MTKAFSMEIKQAMVARLTGVNAVSAAQLSRETSISQQNLSRWLNCAREQPFSASADKSVSAWTVEQKARIIAHAGELTGNELNEFLQREGLELARLKRWRCALAEATGESVGATKRIRRLERELTRMEKALAEAATLLILRETLESRAQLEDDDADAEAEEADVQCAIPPFSVSETTPSSPSPP